MDTTLLVVFLLLLSPRMTGLPLHEILGFIFFIPIMIHLLLAWPWIQGAARKMYKRANRRTRLNFILNSILYILVITELLSGVVISQVVLPGLGVNTINDRVWRSVHNLPLNFVVLFTGFHIAINWGWIVTAFKKRKFISDPGRSIFSASIMRLIIRLGVLLLIAGLISLMWFGIVGNPTKERIYSQNEIARFNPSFRHGLVQFLGETFLVAIVAFVARKWLRIRL